MVDYPKKKSAKFRNESLRPDCCRLLEREVGHVFIVLRAPVQKKKK